ncbi:hypothetical protein SLS62_005416 [Diatrype stigma]|uniref:Uncharacterized protein n=1 Tax=Diatrype stigma TaxID=117547 RepID=A0AAN9USR4_9PEZI
MSLAVPAFEGPAASGGNDWLFADPFAYQYSDIPQHVEGLRSRSKSPAIPTAGSAVSELEGALPVLYESSSGPGNAGERFELEGSMPTLPPPPTIPQARLCYTAPPSPEERNAAGLGPTNFVPASLLPGRGRQQSQVQSRPHHPQPQPHVLNVVGRNNSEIVRSRHANVRLSRTYPSNPPSFPSFHHRRMMTTPAPMPVSGMRSDSLIARAGPPFTSGAGPAPVGPPQVPQQPHHTQQLRPIRTNGHYAPGLAPVGENPSASSTATTPNKDFDSILRDINPSAAKKSKWRQSRSFAYLEKCGTWVS